MCEWRSWCSCSGRHRRRGLVAGSWGRESSLVSSVFSIDKKKLYRNHSRLVCMCEPVVWFVRFKSIPGASHITRVAVAVVVLCTSLHCVASSFLLSSVPPSLHSLFCASIICCMYCCCAAICCWYCCICVACAACCSSVVIYNGKQGGVRGEGGRGGVGGGLGGEI